jgi:hypothetical protein
MGSAPASGAVAGAPPATPADSDLPNCGVWFPKGSWTGGGACAPQPQLHRSGLERNVLGPDLEAFILILPHDGRMEVQQPGGEFRSEPAE